MALIEGMAAGVPGVCFDVGGVRDVIVAPDLGVLVPAGDVDALAGAMRELFDDGRRREAMGARARKSVLARYGVDRLVHDLSRLYREVLHH